MQTTNRPPPNGAVKKQQITQITQLAHRDKDSHLRHVCSILDSLCNQCYQDIKGIGPPN